MSKRRTRTLRLDNIPIDNTYFTDEGYLVDFPIVTTTGIFEYRKANGATTRELRLPEHVFDPESLASYEGKPVIITHEGGEIDASNVGDEIIGTILSAGYQDGDSVRAKIIIHDTDSMKRSGLKELSLGYDQDGKEESGIHEGEPYDVIQTNIRINHLALVQKARAGHTARLRIDGTASTMKGEQVMAKKRNDGTEGLQTALEMFQSRRDQRKADRAGLAGGGSTEPPPQAPTAPSVAPPQKDHAQAVRDNRDVRDDEGDPDNLDMALDTIAKQDEDIDTLLGVIDALGAASTVDSGTTVDEGNVDSGTEDNATEDSGTEDGDGGTTNDGTEAKAGTMNADSVDAIVRERMQLGRLGERINLDGLENMTPMAAKKAIIAKVKPTLRLDGHNTSYINAVFDVVSTEIADKQKDTNYQRGQMFRADASQLVPSTMSAAKKSRERMIERQQQGGQ